jgi:arginase
MPLAMIVGRGPQWMCESVGLATLPEDRVVLVDARDLDPLEAEAVAGSALRHIGVDALASLSLEGPVLVHIDMDVIDSREAPAFNYPVEGGPSVAQLSAALADFAAGTDIRMISISAWSPSKDLDGATGRACRKVLRSLIGG